MVSNWSEHGSAHQRLEDGWDGHKGGNDEEGLAEAAQDGGVKNAIMVVCNDEHCNKHGHEHHTVCIGNVLQHVFPDRSLRLHNTPPPSVMHICKH